jgi:uncharacterized protein YndB with AHSA1/START domain
MTLTSSIGTTINAAPAAVFAWIVDPARASQWGDNLQYLPADHLAIAVGMQADVKLPPDDSAAVLSIKQFDAPTAFSYEVASAKQTLTWTYALDGVTAGTVVTATASVDTANAVNKVEDEVQGDTPLHSFLSWARMELNGSLLGATATNDLEQVAGPRQQDLEQHLHLLLDKLKALVEAAG